MTIDEAIKHCEEVAWELDKKAMCVEEAYQTAEQQNCEQCAADHRQLARWLRDLKMYQQRYLDALQLLKEATADFHKILPLISDCSFCSMYDKEKGECTGESALECADICAWRLHDKFLDVSF